MLLLLWVSLVCGGRLGAADFGALAGAAIAVNSGFSVPCPFVSDL